MKYYLIVGEASGDLHASRLMRSLKNVDEFAEFRFFGGDLMAAEGGTRVKHYKELAYMGFVPVLMHLGTIFSNMKRCKEDIVKWKPDVVILAEKKKTNKWLGEQLGKDKTTISKWCTNTCQPDLGSLMKISKLLEVEVTDLLREDNID